jgi:hypothetical protein
LSRGRKRRKLAALATAMGEGGALASPVTLPSYDDCHPLDWVPDFNNAHLQQAAAGRLTISDPMFHPPAPIDFAPPGRSRC